MYLLFPLRNGLWRSKREISVHSQTVAIAAGVRKLLQELRKGKARPLSKGASSGTACVGRGKRVLGARLLNTCRHRLGNAVNSKRADSIKLFRLVKTSASCKDW